MNDSPHVSIIVPVYKTEAYLSRCVESILQQDCGDFELILIDDGSPDNCPALCDAFARQDSRVKVIHQVNAGVSAARNAGMAVANGTWIWFVDSDDYINPCALSALSNLRPADLYIFNTPFHEVCFCSCDQLLEQHYFTYHLGFAPWNKLYNRNIINSHNLRFDTEETIGEDLLFNLHYYRYCNRLKFINKNYYIYDVREGSAMTSASSERHVNQMRLFRKIRNLLQGRITPINLGVLYFMHLVSGLNQSAEGGLCRRSRAKLARKYRHDFPGDNCLYERALAVFLQNERASLLGKLNLRLLLAGI